MKRIFRKSNIFSFLLGAIIFGGIVGVSAYTIFANDIGYTPKDKTWKKSNGEDITNVKDAIDELYNNVNNNIDVDLLWTNQNLGQTFSSQTINLDLSNYNYVVIVTQTGEGYDILPRHFNVIPIGTSATLTANGSRIFRTVSVQSSSIIFDNNSDNGNTINIPYKIYGIRQNMDIDIGMSE